VNHVRLVQQLPLPLRAFAAASAVVVLLLVLVAALTAHGKTYYDFVRDVIVPLVGPIVAICVPTLFFYLIPLLQNQQKAAVDLFSAYHGEDMRRARNEAWNHFVTEGRELAEPDRNARLDAYLRYLTEPETARKIPPEQDELYQRVSRVLDFFVIVNGCLERGTVDAGMVRAFLGFYYLWWRDEILTPFRQRPLTSKRSMPLWWQPFESLDSACRSNAVSKVP
jgi:hypothetical protein